MKYNSLLFTLFAAVVFFGCSSSREPEAGNQPIRFGVSASGVPDVSVRSVLTGGVLPEGGSVGVFAYSYTGTDVWPSVPDIYSNTEATIGTADNAVSGLEIATKYYAVGKKHAFYAYYPYSAALSGKEITRDVIGDTDDAGEQIDWLCAAPVREVGWSGSTPVRLNFGHMMSMLKIVVFKENKVAAALKLEKLSLTTSDSQKFTLDISTGAVASVDGGSLVFEHATDYAIPARGGGNAGLVANILFLPESAVTSVVLTINGEDFKTPADWGGLTTSVKGNYKTVTFAIDMTQIVVTIGSKDWVIGGESDLTDKEIPTTIIGVGDKDWEYDPDGDIDLRPGFIPVTPWFIGGQDWQDGSVTEI